MKKILFLTNMYPSKKYPSYGIFVKKTYDWLTSEYDITLVKVCKSNYKIQKVLYYLIFYIKAILCGCLGKYDCVYAHYISHSSFPIRCIKKLKGNIKVIGNIHGEDVFSEYDEFKKNRIKAEKFIEKANYIISPSELFAEKLCEEYNIERKRVFISPSGGIDTKLFRKIEKEEAKKNVNLDVNKSYIGFVSRIEKGKGWDVFVDTLGRLMEKKENIQGLIVGDGSEQFLLEKYIEKKGLKEKVTYIPFVTHEKLVYLYNSMDVFCFPSRREAESLGLVGLEAMACKVPCVITSINGPTTYAKNKYNCLLFYPENVSELENKIIQLLNTNEDEIELLQKNARKTAMQYDKDLMKKKFLKFFNEALK